MFGGRQHALVFLAKPAVSVGGDEVVDSIAKQARNESEDTKHGPSTAKLSCEPEGGVAAGKGLAFVDDDHRIALAWIEGVLPQKSLARLGLKGGEAKLTLWIALDQKLHDPVAEITDPVKEHDRVV